MAQRRVKVSKPALLCVVPPYSVGPPAGIAYLLAYAQQQGCSDFGFLDLRLGVPDAYAPTYAHTSVFGDAYVMDVPDLPLVLSLVQAVDSGKEPAAGFPPVIEKTAEKEVSQRRTYGSILSHSISISRPLLRRSPGSASLVALFGPRTF